MDSILLYDPLIMGHHLVYAENFTDWALSRGLKVFFCGYHYQGSLFHRRFADHPLVEFLELDAGLFEHKASFSRMAEAMGETAFYYDHIRPLLFDEDGPAIQVAFLKDLQRRLRPELTLVLYGDEMWSAWEDMARSGEAFETPTWLWLLYAAGHMYDPWGLNARDIRPFLAGQRIFQAVATADEYQAGRCDPGGRMLRYVPDPYRRLEGAPEVLTGEETRQLEELAGFLAGDESSVLLVPGLLEARKNAQWLLDLAGSRPDLSLVILGRKNLPEKVEKQAQAVFRKLAADGRLFTAFSYVPECFLGLAMASPRVRILPLPYRRHDLSSGIQLMALAHGLPCLVPDNGLAARRTLEHGLGGVFSHESPEAFREGALRHLHCDREAFAPACSSFMANFSREAFFAGVDRFFGPKPGAGPGKPEAPSSPADAMVRDAMRRDADLLGLEPEGPDASAWLLQKALLLRQLGRIEDSLACLAKAQAVNMCGTRCATRPAYLRAVILQESGRKREGCVLLNGLLRDRSDHPDVLAWVDAQSDAFVKHQPAGQSRVRVLTKIREDCGEGPLFPALLEVLSDRVWCHIHQGRHRLAEEILRAVLDVEPGHRTTRSILAMILMSTGRLEEANVLLVRFGSSLELNGLLRERADHPDVLAWIDGLSDAFVKLKDLPAGESRAGVLTKIRQDCGEGPLFPALLEVLSDRVWYHIHQGRPRLAEEILRSILDVEPEHRRSLFILAMNHMSSGRLEEAEVLLTRILESASGDWEARKARAAAWAQMGRHDEAVEAFTDLARTRGDVSAYLNLSDVLRYAGRFDESMAALEQGFHLGACTETVRSRKAARIEAERAALAAKQGTGNHAPTS
jgi:tetratricopeptide (TPR) repeat protein